MNSYHLFELALVSAAVGFSGWRVFARYFKPRPAAEHASAGQAASPATGCTSCGSGKSGCGKIS